MRTYSVYILASHSRRLYVGVTGDLRRRIAEHNRGLIPGFTRRYRINRLVYAEFTFDIRAAIRREKRLKAWPRWRKERLIELENAGWLDLAAHLSSRRSERSERVSGSTCRASGPATKEGE